MAIPMELFQFRPLAWTHAVRDVRGARREQETVLVDFI